MDVERSISLHNELAAIHAASPYLHPDCHLRRNFFSAFGDPARALRRRLRGDLIAFLEGTDHFTCEPTSSAAETASSSGDSSSASPSEDHRPTKRLRRDRVIRTPSLTPHLQFPHPDHLFAYASFAVADDPTQDCLATDVVLLYHGIADTQWGGLFVDLDSGRAHWASLDSSSWPLPRPEVWVPLADALDHYLTAWRAGTYYLMPETQAPEEPEGCVLAQPFADADLQAALDEWTRLLDAVESRVPAIVADVLSSEEQEHRALLSEADMQDEDTLRDLFLLPPEDVDEDEEARWAPSFALQFVLKARAPRDGELLIAPGLRCFSLEGMRKLLEANNTEQRAQACETRMLEWSQRPVLLFPSLDEVQEWKQQETQRLHRDILLSDTPGLYITPPYDGLQDETVFISPKPVEVSTVKSNTGLFMHSTTCPYFSPHCPRLVSVLRCWRKLVESGTVHIGTHGVEGRLGDIWDRARQTPEGRSAFNMGRCS